MDDLNTQQRLAVTTIEGPSLVLAGAGSGKTRVITRKIAYLIKTCNISARNIVAVTFTNKAAREMKQRVSALLEGVEGRGLRVSTFHNLGLHIMRSELQHLGYKPGFSIFDSQDSHNLIKEILKSEGGNDEMAKEYLWKISSLKSQFISVEQAINDPELAGGEMTATIYARYNQYLRAYNAVDFDDLLRLPVELLQQNREVRERWQERIHFLLVDEYQDTNTAQYEMVKLLAGLRAALTVVGDDDQSIYAWRGAQPENLRQLQVDFPHLKVIKLEQNYRSMGRILKAANQLISNNDHIFEKRLWSDKGYGDPIRVVSAKSDEDEAAKVVSRILQHKFQQGCDYGRFAILYRSNHQSRPLEKALREHRIPYSLTGGTSFFSLSEIKDVMAYLRLIINPDDDAAFLRIINTPRREIGAKTLEKLGNYSATREISMLQASSEMGLQQHLSAKGCERLKRFSSWMDGLARDAHREQPTHLLDRLINESEYLEWLSENTNNPKSLERRQANIEELRGWIKRMADKDGDSVGLAEIISKLALFDMLDRQSEEESEDAVSLMTLHAAKGLEFPIVFLIGFEEEILPHRVSIEEGNIAEERRLAYVGITRAQEHLTISHVRKRRKGGELVHCQVSQFLGELPQDDLYREGDGVEKSDEERQATGKAQLANLREMLK